MVVVMKERATEAQVDAVIARLIELGMDVHRSSGTTRTVLGVVGAGKVEKEMIEILDGVHEVLRITEPYKRASRAYRPEDTIVQVDDVRIGGDEVIVIAGPCSAETEEQCHASAAPRRSRSPSSPRPWKLYGELRGLYAPPRRIFAPARLTAAAVASTCSGLSAEHGPAITMTSSPPIRTSPTVMTVSSGLNVRPASL